MSAAVTRFKLSNVKILALDDCPPAMDILSQILLGFCVEKTIKCTSVEEAISALSIEKYNLVIVDDRMMGSDGFELVAWIRADPKALNYTVPLMLMTGNPTKALTLRARDTGANYVIAKPLVPGVLLSRIHLIARNNREFVTSDRYRGPDRRTQIHPLPDGVQERRADALRLLKTPERAMSQDEINSLFG